MPPFCIDDVVGVLDRLPLSFPGAALIAAFSYHNARKFARPTFNFLDHLRSTRWLSTLLAFVVLKATNRVLNRLVRNHGWTADPPKWSFVKGVGDVVLITGGAGGIGKEMVEILAKKTSNIAILDMSAPLYSCTNVHYYKCDVTDPAAIAAVAKQVREDIGHPTVLINNAGILRGKTILENTPEECMLTYKVNVLGAFNILKEFLPHIISINHGHIMTTASSASYMSLPQMGDYASSKAAVLALHEVLTAELVHRYNAPRVRTSVICPTKVETPLGAAMKSGEQQFLMPTLQPAWLAARMVKIIESGLSDHLVTPNAAGFMLPAVRALPAWYGWMVNTVGRTDGAVTNAGNVEAAKVYPSLADLDASHASVAPASPVESAQPAAPIPAQNPDPFADLDDPLLPADTAPPAFTAAPIIPSPFHSPPYEGLEYRLGPFKIHPAELKPEIAALAALFVYLVVSLVGRRSNAARASAWFAKHSGAFKEEFAQFGVGKEGFEREGGDEFVAYGTGRRGVEGVQVTVKTAPMHDLLNIVFNLVRGVMDFNYSSGADRVTIDLKLRLPAGTPGAKFCWAVCERGVLRTIRDARWDLKTFTHVSEFAGLPDDLIAMSEHGDESIALLKGADVGLIEALKVNAPGREFFESLVISDMPAGKPDEDKPTLPDNNYHMILTLKIPPKGNEAATKGFVRLAGNIADVLNAKPSLLPAMTVAKIRQRRAEVLKQLQNAAPSVQDAQADARAAANAKEQQLIADRKRQEEEREEAKLRQMTKAERVKYLDKKKATEREKAIAKLAKKQKK
ncbi:hypothetical protein RQP46_002618 [Phenoliferia psychrophenolica]